MMELKGIQFLTLCLAVCIFVGYARSPKKIVNGQFAQPGQFPHQVSLQNLWRQHFCGGSIITSTHILTAAHCMIHQEGQILKRADEMQVVTGVIDNQAQNHSNTFSVDLIIRKKFYNRKTMLNDIAIMKLVGEIIFNDFQKPIRLPDQDIPAGTLVTASGWGVLWAVHNGPMGPQPRYLQKLQMRILDQDKCVSILGNHVTPGQVCAERAKRTGMCYGDSGGPLVYGDRLIGIASWLRYTCAANYPDVFIRVYHYLKWIKKWIKITSSS